MFLNSTCPKNHIAYRRRGQRGSAPGPGAVHPTIATSRQIAAIAVLFLVVLATAEATADQISAAGRNYPGVQIAGLVDGRLDVRTADGTTMFVPLSDIDWLIIDRTGQLEDLNEAERAMLAGDAHKAITRYERASRVASGFWGDVVSARSIAAYDGVGQLDEAMHHLVRLAQSRFSGPAVASRMIPRSLPAQRNARFARSIRELDAALSTAKEPPQQILLTLIRFDLLRRSGDRRAFEAAPGVLNQPIPPEIRTPQVYAMVAAALDMALAEGQHSGPAMAALDRAIENCPDESLPDLLLLKGRELLSRASTRDDVIRAAWPFLRVAVHMPQDRRAAQALYLAATALDRLGSKEPAMKALDDCLSRPEISDELRAQAEALRQRLAAGTSE